MKLVNRIARYEREMAAELQEAAQRRLQRDRELQKELRLPLPAAASDAERKEALRRLLTMQDEIRQGSAEDEALSRWFAWVDLIHAKYSR